MSAQGETLVFPQAIALLTRSSAEPLQRFLCSGSPWEGEYRTTCESERAEEEEQFSVGFGVFG